MCSDGCGRPAKVKGFCRSHYTRFWQRSNRPRTKAHKLPSGEAARRDLLLRYKKRAELRGFAFELSEAEFDCFTKSDCWYCGTPPSQLWGGPHANGKYIYTGIDRVDNAIGYVSSNCVPCCVLCNRAKGTMDVTAFIALAKRISSHQCIIQKS